MYYENCLNYENFFLAYYESFTYYYKKKCKKNNDYQLPGRAFPEHCIKKLQIHIEKEKCLHKTDIIMDMAV